MSDVSKIGAMIPALNQGIGGIDRGGAKLSSAEALASKVHHSSEEAKEAAVQFESLLLHQMLASMWQSLPGDGLLSSSREEGLYRDMLNEAVAESIAKNQSIGITDFMLRELDPSENE